jgi:hypothetical protein
MKKRKEIHSNSDFFSLGFHNCWFGAAGMVQAVWKRIRGEGGWGELLIRIRVFSECGFVDAVGQLEWVQ